LSTPGLARLIDVYADGLLTKDQFAPRVQQLRERVARLEEQLERCRVEQVVEAELRRVIGRLAEFAAVVRAGLARTDRTTQREIILALVRRVEVDEQQVKVVLKVEPPSARPDEQSSQHCSDRARDLALVATLPIWSNSSTPRTTCELGASLCLRVPWPTTTDYGVGRAQRDNRTRRGCGALYGGGPQTMQYG
jgi:site-specific DNA recombinase